jgi:hypothetical protein
MAENLAKCLKKIAKIQKIVNRFLFERGVWICKNQGVSNVESRTKKSIKRSPPMARGHLTRAAGWLYHSRKPQTRSLSTEREDDDNNHAQEGEMGPRKRLRITRPPGDASDSDSDKDWEPFLASVDGLKVAFGGYEEEEIEEIEELDLNDEAFCQKMIQMAVAAGDDPKDEDWVVPRQRWMREDQKLNRKGV